MSILRAPLSKGKQKLKNEFEKLRNQEGALDKVFNSILVRQGQSLDSLTTNLSIASDAICDTKELLNDINKFSDKLLTVPPIDYIKALALKKSNCPKKICYFKKIL